MEKRKRYRYFSSSALLEEGLAWGVAKVATFEFNLR